MSRSAKRLGIRRAIATLVSVRFFIALCLLFAWGCVSQVAPGSSVSGEVRDYTSGEPVAGAVVRVAGSQDPTLSTQTNAAGQFHLVRLGERATIEISAAGKARLQRALRLAQGEERVMDLYMLGIGQSLPQDNVLFERGGRIWAVDSAGLEPKCLTADLSGIQASPAWGTDRTVFAFIHRIPGRSQILTRHTDGTPARYVGDVPDSTSQLRWSPDGRTLVFAFAARTTRGLLTELRWLDVFSGAQRDLMAGQEERDPAFSRDGRHLAWARLLPGRTWELWLTSPDGGASRPLLTKFNAREPSFSPDGKRIAFASNREGAYELYEMAIESPRPRKVITMPPDGFARRPLYAPLGDELLFESNVTRGAIQGIVSLYAVHIRTGRVREVIDDAREASW